MSCSRYVICVLVVLAVFVCCSQVDALERLDQPWSNDGRFLDVHSFLFDVSGRLNLSLVVSRDLYSPIKSPKGETIREVLENYLSPENFDYAIIDGCLYVAGPRELSKFVSKLANIERHFPAGNGQGGGLHGVFPSVELAYLARMIRAASGAEIRVSEDLRSSVMLRLNNMCWQRLTLAIIYLNRYNIIRTEFSVLITPERTL